MIKYYSHEKMEEFANELNKEYGARRLIRPSEIDPYDLVDLVGARLSFQYISPDNSYIGATVFEDMVLPVWPERPYYDGLKPEFKFFHKNTIIVDKDLAEATTKQDRYRYNFTVVHECFHLRKHRYYFQNGAHRSTGGYRKYGLEETKSELDKIEEQANYMTAAFLMPRGATLRLARTMLGYRGETIPFGYPIKENLSIMASRFGVNYTPMVYRLQALEILDEYFDPTLE